MTIDRLLSIFETADFATLALLCITGLTIGGVAKYLEKTLGGKWDYQRVYKLIYRRENTPYTASNPPEGFLPFRKLAGQWYSLTEWLDDAVKSQEWPYAPNEQPAKPKRKSPKPPSDTGRWGKI